MKQRPGKPMVKLTASDAATAEPVRRLGFLDGEISVPQDFDYMGSDEIQALFGVGS
jgi:hypothetical protein